MDRSLIDEMYAQLASTEETVATLLRSVLGSDIKVPYTTCFLFDIGSHHGATCCSPIYR
jgi:hypothetical protein